MAVELNKKMSDLHVHAHPVSPPARSVLGFLKLSGVPFEFHLVDLPAREHLTEEFAKINPFQAVPAIVHGDYNLWESAAIIAYVADAFKVDNNWYPKDLKIRGKINAYLHWHHQNIVGPISGLLLPKVIAPKFLGAPELSPEAEVPLRAKFEECLDNIKWCLAETGNIARTAEPSIADVAAYCMLAQAEFTTLDLTAHPEVKAWYGRIGANEVVTEIHQTLRQVIAGFASQATP